MRSYINLIMFVLILLIILVLLSFLIFPETPIDDDDDERWQPSKTPAEPLPEMSGDWELPPDEDEIKIYPIPPLYAPMPKLLIDDNRPAMDIAADQGTWYDKYRDSVGLSHEEIRAQFPAAPNLDVYRERYEQKKVD